MIDWVVVVSSLWFAAMLALGAWIGLRITGRKFVLSGSDAPLSRKIGIVAAAAVAVLFGQWIRRGAILSSPASIVVLIGLVLMVVMLVFGTAKQA